ncbi:MAG: HEAT repeat domain-containing protein [Planctomycetota bacterium]|nr:HEAT repeat domain-containing protein [Planctomycetota bacterium]
MRLTIRLAVTVLLGCAVAAQQPSDPAAAIAAFEAARAKPEAERSAAALKLARVPGTRATELLLADLGTAKDPNYLTTLVRALGDFPRPQAVEPINLLLIAEESSPTLRNTAATALAKQGEEGIAKLGAAALAEGTSASAQNTRTYAMIGLSRAENDSAWTALAKIAATAAEPTRGSALRYLLKAPPLPSVTAAREAAARAGDSSVMTRAGAVRQLVEASHEDADALLTELIDRPDTLTSTSTHSDLLAALLARFGPKYFDAFLTVGAAVRPASRKPVEKEIAALTAQHSDFVAWLSGALPRRESPSERCFGLELLNRVQGPEVTELLLEQSRAREPEVVSTALRLLGERGDQAAVPAIRKLLRAKDEPRRIEATLALHALLAKDPAWREELIDGLRGTGSKDVALRALAFDLLAELGDERVLEYAYKDLDHKNWRVRAAAIDACRIVRNTATVPELIDRLDDESGRLREDVLDALQALTAMRFHDQDRWRTWWKTEKAGFQLIPADAFAKAPASRSAQAVTASYYGIPMVSDRVVFVVDISGSMAAQVGTSASRNRLDEAKAQLLRVLEGATKQFQFNIVPFHTTVDAVFDEMLPAADRPKASARDKVAALKPTGGTNVHDAMARAFAEPDVDTIYLLSDGSPSAGPIVDPDQLATEIARWNRSRRIRIHCVSIGAESPMLERIATESGGEYAMTR